MANVLVGCEFSGTVREAFRWQGHRAVSCDLLPSDAESVDYIGLKKVPEDGSGEHYEGNVFDIMEDGWDLIILHPPCTAICVSGNGTYGKNMKKNHLRQKAVSWTVQLWETAVRNCDKVCLENPVSVIWRHIGTPQYVQPYQFGHGETKKTGLLLHGLPNLYPTEQVEGREQKVWKMGPSEDRWKKRSLTYQGIAEAMASQWGPLLEGGS